MTAVKPLPRRVPGATSRVLSDGTLYFGPAELADAFDGPRPVWPSYVCTAVDCGENLDGGFCDHYRAAVMPR